LQVVGKYGKVDVLILNAAIQAIWGVGFELKQQAAARAGRVN